MPLLTRLVMDQNLHILVHGLININLPAIFDVKNINTNP